MKVFLGLLALVCLMFPSFVASFTIKEIQKLTIGCMIDYDIGASEIQNIVTENPTLERTTNKYQLARICIFERLELVDKNGEFDIKAIYKMSEQLNEEIARQKKLEAAALAYKPT